MKEVNRKLPKGEEILYAVVGAGDFAIEKVKGAGKVPDRKTAQKYYRDFVTRGRALSGRIRKAVTTS